MKQFFAILILAGLSYGGYLFYRQVSLGNTRLSTPSISQGQLLISQTSNKLGNLAAVLGASISDTFETGKEMLNDVTEGASEPIINQLMTKTQETLKDLPRKEAEKIKYEFCRGVITEYESSSSPSPSQQP